MSFLSLVKDVGGLALKVTTPFTATVNVVGDLASRAVHLVKGEMNFDITGNGPQVSGLNALRPGDVLCKQGTWNDAVVIGVGVGQIVLNRGDHRYFGAGLLGHALIYLGEGLAAEAVAKGVVEGRLDGPNPDSHGLNYSDYNFYVVRNNRADVAAQIVETARATINKADYNHAGLGVAAAGIDAGDISGDPTKITSEKIAHGQKPKMFCSEFVVYCLNVATDKVLGSGHRYFQRSQAIISPEELYVGLRDSGDWSYVGELHKHNR